jgi:dTMP kinase
MADWLRARRFDVVTCRDPGATELGNRLRSILMERDSVPISMRAEMLLFMASRAQMVEEIIRPALASGHVVICDRFLLATIVYQGYAGGLDPAEVAAMGRSATGGLLPDLTIVLDVRAGYLEAARPRGEESRLYPAPILRIDAAADPDTVFAQIQREVMLVLALDPRS